MTAARQARPSTYIFFFAAFAFLVFAAHAAYMGLPYFGDELGQFVPAALDILRDNAWVPHSTEPNIHPPGVMAYLAAVWRVFGYSIAATRLAMLALASFGVLFTFLLAIRLCEGRAGAPAFFAVLLLLCDPLFYMQGMMAQLDMPAMVFSTLGLLLFLRERHGAAAIACTAAVLAKETSLVLPAVLLYTLVREQRRRDALYYAAPFVALAIWIAALWRSTGTPFGNPGFEHYNVAYPLHPMRLATSLVRRVYELFIADFRWVGAIAIVLASKRFGIYRGRAWRVTLLYALAFFVLITVFGGAELERYELPLLPVFYIAGAGALSTFPAFPRIVGLAAMCAGLIAGLFVNPPFPFPYENNLAMADFVELHEHAAHFLEREYPNEAVFTAWPLTAALRRPEFGYVEKPLRTVETSDLHASTLSRLDPARVNVLVLYSRTWDPEWGVLQNELIADFLRRFYDYEPEMTEKQCLTVLGLKRVARWEQRGQWIEIYARNTRLPAPSL